ncbi:glucose-1-phosphate adenylyltransferase subunit GlgD [candidate division KSB3 bacterium]|uniref:Glucose-1-phosphate adenylyltransferase n=1 Tax=candidate division KSB3 bacterium TaxID=2044937 RepID=A0A2G6E926_9BACT|nr:MAG: glucose-1-phosphate adenylyltransferase subunit GlgD [candidate division KSB3 bacterium]PIE29528.1 MAG: glucose-1-phosphate adenylyltransferase subunit GlgD [candidate division KSB3 bacterium]
MNETIAMILAGGQGSRLTIFSSSRAKPAVPFGGIYRIIDFSLSNAAQAGINVVGVLTQYRPSSLMDHLKTGAPWDLIGRKHEIKVLPPYTGTSRSDWYKGTADAIYQNLWYIKRYTPKNVLILSGDHIYNMDYWKMIEYHNRKGAALTIATMQVDIEEAHRFGIMTINQENRIIRFQEKPAEPESTLASMGVYVFDAETLIARLEADAKDPDSKHDFGGNIIPAMITEQNVYNYVFDGYWKDVGTIQSYLDANMDMLRPDSGLDIATWETRTNLEERHVADRPPTKFLRDAKVSNSVVSRGGIIDGTVEQCVLSPGVIVKKGAVLKNAVIMHDCIIGEGAVIENVVSDKDVVFGKGCKVGVSGENTANEKYPGYLHTGISIFGKGAMVPENVTIEHNCIICPDVSAEDYPGSIVTSGKIVGKLDV